MTLRLTTHKFFLCPKCQKTEHRYDHLDAGDGFGPWYCDECGCAFKGQIGKVSGALLPDVTILENTSKQRTLVLLRLDRGDGSPLWFITEGMVFDGKPINPERDRYYYEEHSCPTNYVHCCTIVDGEDADPHGVFKYVATVPRPSDFDDVDRDYEELRKLFPQLAGTT